MANIENKITNCLTAIPQDIMLEINNGNRVAADTCTVYKGDGSTYTIPASTNFSHASSAGTFMLIWTGSAARHQNINTCFSGSTAPAQGSFSGNYAVWYDTTNKVIKLTNDGGSTWIGDNSFPLCVYNSTGTSASSIDQVFNGFGYIGSTIFALPGVEGLIPNGFIGKSRNNVKLTNNQLLTLTPSFNGSSVLLLGSNNLTAWGKSDYSYSNDDNYNYYKDGKSYALCKIGEYYKDSTGRITSFNPKTTIQATDYYDFKQLDDSAAKLGENNVFTGVNNRFFNGSGNASFAIVQSTLIDRETNPSKTLYASWLIQDKNGKRIANFYVDQSTTGKITANMIATGRDGGDARISTSKDVNGNITTYAPTPATTDNSTKIATTQFVNNFFNTAGKVTTKCMPNYAAAVSIGSGTTVIPKDSVLIIKPSQPNYANLTVTVNNAEVYKYSGDEYLTLYKVPILVPKNATVVITGNLATAIYYPLVGA